MSFAKERDVPSSTPNLPHAGSAPAQALAAADVGDRATALDLARRFASDPACVGRLASTCGRLLFALGDVDGAIKRLEADGPSAPPDVARVLEYRSLFGRAREAIASLPLHTTAEVHARVAGLLERRGDRELARHHLRAALELAPRSARVRMALADTLVGTSEAREGTALLDAVMAKKATDPTYLGAAARMAVGAGDFGRARAFAERLLALDAHAAPAHDVLGHLALFRGDGDEARRYAEALVATGEVAAGRALRGAALALTRTDDAAALVELEAAGEQEDSAWEAQTWRAEIMLRRGARDEAAALSDRAIASARGFLLPARIVRVLAHFGSKDYGSRGPAGTAYGEAEYLEIEDGVRLMCPATPRPVTVHGRMDLLRQALSALVGNRTLQPSRVEGEELVAVPLRPGPRWASRRLLGLVATRAEEELFPAFDAVIAEHPDSGLPRCHRAEVNLWLGHYEAARSDLETVIREFPYSRWAYIGLATLETLRGRHERALEVLERGVERMDDTTGPGVHGVRGEALRRLGRPAEAIAPLEQARASSPRRVSASVNLALAYAATGREDAARKVFGDLLVSAYPLLYDAAEAVGASLEAPSLQGAVLEQALRFSLGNRSASVITWRVGDSPLRCLTDASSGRSIAKARERERVGVGVELNDTIEQDHGRQGNLSSRRPRGA